MYIFFNVMPRGGNVATPPTSRLIAGEPRSRNVPNGAISDGQRGAITPSSGGSGAKGKTVETLTS